MVLTAFPLSLIKTAVWKEQWDAVVLPGGVPGTPNPMNDVRILELIRRSAENENITAAICAAPAVFEKASIINQSNVTIHPSFNDRVDSANFINTRLMIDGIIITAQAARSAIEFAYKLVELLFGKERVTEINKGVLAEI
jgi:4-methyl-5(b-hydroxyethyl)-thiazole monophosphate biosynthesis